jgi:hypothetical protein
LLLLLVQGLLLRLLLWLQLAGIRCRSALSMARRCRCWCVSTAKCAAVRCCCVTANRCNEAGVQAAVLLPGQALQALLFDSQHVAFQVAAERQQEKEVRGEVRGT